MVNVLVIGKDPTLFKGVEVAGFGDARARHMFYARRLRERCAGSEIRILTYTPRTEAKTVDEPCQGLRLYGTHSRHRALFLIDCLRRLPALVQGWRPDVITVQTPWEEGVVGLLMARVLHSRFLPQLHFDIFSDEWLHEAALNRWRRVVAKSVLRRADRVRVVSTVLRDKLIRNWQIPAGKVLVAPVGVQFQAVAGEKASFKRSLRPDLAQKNVVLFVGRLCAQKNLPLWIEVARIVAEQVPGAIFVIVGDGAEAARVKRTIESLGLQDRFLLCGSKSHTDLPEIYAAADVLLLTSHYEGFGRVVVEAFLSGVPVVSTASSGPEDIIEDGCTGYLLPPGDEAGLADRVVELLEDPDRAATFGTRGRAAVLRRYTLEILSDRMIDTWLWP